MKLHKNDTVKIIKGKDKGKKGKIMKVYPETNSVLVEGVNQYKRHLKARSQNQPSEIVTITKPLSVSNVALVCSKCGKITRIGFAVKNDGKVRICKKCGEKI